MVPPTACLSTLNVLKAAQAGHTRLRTVLLPHDRGKAAFELHEIAEQSLMDKAIH